MAASAISRENDRASVAAPDGLYWSKNGIVACSLHAPTPDSATWSVQGWAVVPQWRRDFRGLRLQCQFCFGRPYAHHREAQCDKGHAASGTKTLADREVSTSA
jgi:hypothetical protein